MLRGNVNSTTSCDFYSGVGHWEVDTIVGPFHGGRLLTGVERQSGYLVMALLPRGGALSTYQTMIELLKSIAHKIKTAT